MTVLEAFRKFIKDERPPWTIGFRKGKTHKHFKVSRHDAEMLVVSKNIMPWALDCIEGKIDKAEFEHLVMHEMEELRRGRISET